jgi:hypothetical protein
LRGKQTGDEVEVFGGVGVDVLVERVGDIFTAVFFNSVPCTVWGDGVEEVVNAIGVGDRGGAFAIRGRRMLNRRRISESGLAIESKRSPSEECTVKGGRSL